MLAVRAENLTKTYAGEVAPVEVFRGLSFELPERVFAAIMGPSGVGKSTLLHLLGGIDRPDAGRVEVFGASLAEMPAPERARFRNARIGLVFQFHHLLPEFTAEENVAFPHRIAGWGPGRHGASLRRCSSEWGWPTAGITARAPSRAASSSASRSRGPWRGGRGCSWQMSPRATSTRNPPRASSI